MKNRNIVPALLDSPGEYQRIRSVILKKTSLKRLYAEFYARFSECVKRCPDSGPVIELGSGAGFLKNSMPETITSDLLTYPGLDVVFDAAQLPFQSNSVRMLCMIDVLHHISDAELFFKEVERCLAVGGRIFMIDQFVGWLSYFIYKYVHHEDFDPDAESWNFSSTGPLSGANGALPTIIFVRDLTKFRNLFPNLALQQFTPHSPLKYWLAGGLKKWTLLPGWAYPAAAFVDTVLGALSPKLCSFVDIELVKTG